jgi:lysophospholipase L1-like esterase
MRQQLLYFIGSILVLPFLPILIYLGKKVRKSVPDLPEASENITASIIGEGSEIRLLTLGESTIAGVGVADHKEGITGGIAKTLNTITKKTIHWQVLARNGYTAERVNLKLVSRIPSYHIDLIVIGLGGNDTFQFNSPLTFRKHLALTIESIQKRQPSARIVIVNMPPIADFPAFPWVIKKVLGSLISLHGSVIKDLPLRYNNVFYIDGKIRLKDWLKRVEKGMSPSDFFSDGVHPSAMTYGLWGKEVGEYIVKKVL